METHVFNEETKRFEPLDETCAFCGRRISEKPDDNLYIPLFKEGERLNVVVYRKVSYKRIDIGLARCPHCKEIHEKQKRKTRLYTMGITILAIVVLYGIIGFYAFLIGLVVALIAFLIVRAVLEKRMAKKENILPREEAAMQYGLVRYFINEGWTFTQPTA